MTNIKTLCMSCMKDIEESLTCPDCGELIHTQKNAVALPLKTVLNKRFLVGRVLGNPGGFGITYLVWDMLLETTAAIKEFLPLSSVSREPKNTSIRANSKQDKIFFNQGLQIFLKEAKTLAQFSHPNIVRIRDCFTSNNTAYLVMEYHKGHPLDQLISLAGGRLSESRALEIMVPILDGLEAVHKKGFLHRDIKPQNIYVTHQGTPLLLDFGASRFALADSTKNLTVMLSTGFAPFEQYHKKGKQGIWTDLYSIGATLYYITTGTMPNDAIERQHDDKLIPPIKLNPELSASFNHAILTAMAITPLSRPNSIANFKDILLVKEEEQLFPIPHSAKVTRSTLSAPKLAVKKADHLPDIRQYGKKNPKLSYGRFLIYIGIVAILWSGWSTRQMLKQNKLNQAVDEPYPLNSTQFTEDYIDFSEEIELIEFEPEMEESINSAEEEITVIEFEPEMEEIINSPERPPIDGHQDQAKKNLYPTNQNTIQKPKHPEPMPRNSHLPLHPPIPKAAFIACQDKNIHSRCSFPDMRHVGICLPERGERKGLLACMPKHPPPPQPLRKPRFNP